MQNPKVAIYYLNGPNTWTLQQALSQRGITQIEGFTTIPYGQIDPAVNFVVMILDQDFKDYDMECYTNGQPDWREEVAFEYLDHEIKLMHDCFPNAKIFLVDCTSMTGDDIVEDAIDEDISEEIRNLHMAQWEREKTVCRRLRQKFFSADYCVAEEFRLTSSGQESVAQRIADLIAGS